MLGQLGSLNDQAIYRIEEALKDLNIQDKITNEMMVVEKELISKSYRSP